MIVRPIHGGNVHSENSDTIDFSANINPWGPPRGLKDHLMSAYDQIIHYPEPTANNLKNQLSIDLQVAMDSLVVGNGAIELIYLLAQAKRYQTVVVITPTFQEYEYSLRKSSAKIIHYFLEEGHKFSLIVKEFITWIDTIDGKPDAIYFCNPNNPTGSYVPSVQLKPLLEFTAHNQIDFIVDESFIEFTETCGLIHYTKKYHNLLLIRSMTKFYSIPGLRLGYMICAPTVASLIESYQPPWSVNVFAQYAGEYVLRDQNFVNNSIFQNRMQRFYLQSVLQSNKLFTIYPSYTNFLLLKTDSHLVGNLISHLYKHKILIRDCSNFVGLEKGYIRIAVKGEAENQKLLDAVSKFR
ncbi:hypothetical protein BHU72_08005 [Desulfuribacillus stibiiarsenatis]|uniref:Aminotransferase n=1 Tax=Desulfuribacillus stibiiarsenatis TaxID=1390249 RepID=A0A1E5L3S8_9FIRM|nr:histidinol-phosphate transaminase [Desulfuribacillus stibiiarsenatis]OEH84767.1 hypothetical protein BHU72_08005 [Desulfuribacillus stibiiarsenatis]